MHPSNNHIWHLSLHIQLDPTTKEKTVENGFTNTGELLAELSQMQLEEDGRLISLDVCDMFNNIDTDKAIDIIVERIEKSEKFAKSNLTRRRSTRADEPMPDKQLLHLQQQSLPTEKWTPNGEHSVSSHLWCLHARLP